MPTILCTTADLDLTYSDAKLDVNHRSGSGGGDDGEILASQISGEESGSGRIESRAPGNPGSQTFLDMACRV